MATAFDVTQVVPLVTKVSASSVNTPNNEQSAAFRDHVDGVSYIHPANAIAVADLTDALANAALPDTTASTLFTVLLRIAHSLKTAVNPDAASWAAAISGLATDENVHDIYTLVRSHNHHTATTGGQLNQVDTHQNNDSDTSPTSIHHTLGTGANQAAAGNHAHAIYALASDRNATGGYAGLTGGLIADSAISTAISRVVDVNSALSAMSVTISGKSAVGHVHGAGSEATIVASGLAADSVTTVKIQDNAVSTAKINDTAVTTAKIANNAVDSTKLASDAVTTAKILDSNVTTGKLANDAVTSAKIATNAVGSDELAAQTVDDTKIVAGGLGTLSIKDAAITTAKIAAGAITHDKIADGAILVTNPKSLSVQILPLRKWNATNISVEYLGEILDLTAHIPGAGLRRYVLIEVNSTGASHLVDGDTTGGTPVRPSKTPGTTGLGFVYLEYGMTFIDTTNIYPWLGPDDGSGSGGSGGSPIGHAHGIGNEARVLSYGLDEGYPQTTPTPSFYISVSGMHYRHSSGQVRFWAGGLVGPFGVPSSGMRIDAIYLDPATGLPVINAGVVNATTPVPPSFVGDQKSIGYVHMRAGATFVGGSDDGVNGWVEDARTWVASGGGAATINGVSTGGSGVASFTAGIVTSPGGANPLSSIAAPTGTVVGTSDAQTLTNKTLSQAAAGTVGVIARAAGTPTTDLWQWQDSSSVGFGNVSRYKTFGFGQLESTGVIRVIIGGTSIGTAALKQPSQLYIGGNVQSFDNTVASAGLQVATTHGAAGQANAVAYSVILSPARTGGDTGTFLQSSALYCQAASFATNNYAAILVGLVQITGNANITGALSTTGATTHTGTLAVSSTITGAGITSSGGITNNGGGGISSTVGDIRVSGAGATYFAFDKTNNGQYVGFSMGSGVVSITTSGGKSFTMDGAGSLGLVTGAALNMAGAISGTTSVASSGHISTSGGYFINNDIGGASYPSQAYMFKSNDMFYVAYNSLAGSRIQVNMPTGAVAIVGALSKGSGTFLIDHPLDPENTELYHGFVEAPYYDLLYSDTVALKNGKAIVDIDAYARMRTGTFEALNTRVRVFTTNETGWGNVRGKYAKGKVTIEAQDNTSNDIISWLVIGERQDAFVKSHLDPRTDKNGRLQTEWDKPDAPDGTEKGTNSFKGGYWHPTAHGKKDKHVVNPDEANRVRKEQNDNLEYARKHTSETDNAHKDVMDTHKRNTALIAKEAANNDAAQKKVADAAK